MIILTGGAGFIGSCFLWKLNREGIEDILVVDDLAKSDKKNNLECKKYRQYLHKKDFLDRVKSGGFSGVEHIVHMGACSSTILSDKDYYMENNYEYSKTLASWAIKEGINFLYASSAATYGSGEFGYSDDNDTTRKLKPLNLYGLSKQLFDLWVLNEGHEEKVTGLKFFNVFGPNEYHKEQMMSVICKNFTKVRDEGVIRLFKSYRDDYKDGQQKRDFIYVKDAVEVMYYFFKNPEKGGIFNLGTGESRTWNDLANAMFAALGKEPVIEYIEMPQYLREKYQYFTEASMDKLRSAGCDYKFRSLEESIEDYTKYLSTRSYL